MKGSEKRKCEICGEMFTVNLDDFRQRHKKTCSEGCKLKKAYLDSKDRQKKVIKKTV